MINKLTHLAVGKIYSSFALKGGVKVKPYSDDLSHFRSFKGKVITLLRHDTIKELTVLNTEVKGEWPILFFEGYTTPEIAQSDLKGGEIYVPRHLASPLKKDEFYLGDLIGLNIYYKGNSIGICTSYFEAAHIIIEVQQQDRTVYFPFIKEYFEAPNFINNQVELIKGDLIE
ncbi:ribosome maturation factor RimM [Entomospira nematocerorum]|uniref:Ribosome maturation factor RimM n=1 Tax=Entomospira nematocerorum TaxID=2719987 RepID=A0A968KXD8_9SPIO|nr:ribosome maturation factor RimM [Entomospira nematocera]NIZ46472.1 16S rRNA processing protein RimM [Entomospira nematocera]WDI33727.1 ribosome maturation factor RimM [Entomospira nematocera]